MACLPRIAAEQPVLAQKPKIASPGNWPILRSQATVRAGAYRFFRTRRGMP